MQVKSVKDEQGKILTDPTAVKVQWKEYFDKLYNDPNSVDEDCLVNFPESHNDEDIPTIGEDEVEAAVKRMKLKEAASVDLSIEEIKQASGLKVLHRLCKMIWDQEIIPPDSSCTVIIPIHKKKDRLDCSNYRGIRLLCHCSKIFSSIILQRIKKGLKRYSQKHKQVSDPTGAP